MDRLRPGARNAHLGRTVGKAVTKTSLKRKSFQRRDRIFDSSAAVAKQSHGEGSEVRVSDLEWVSRFPHLLALPLVLNLCTCQAREVIQHYPYRPREERLQLAAGHSTALSLVCVMNRNS